MKTRGGKREGAGRPRSPSTLVRVPNDVLSFVRDVIRIYRETGGKTYQMAIWEKDGLWSGHLVQSFYHDEEIARAVNFEFMDDLIDALGGRDRLSGPVCIVYPPVDTEPESKDPFIQYYVNTDDEIVSVLDDEPPF